MSAPVESVTATQPGAGGITERRGPVFIAGAVFLAVFTIAVVVVLVISFTSGVPTHAVSSGTDSPDAATVSTEGVSLVLPAGWREIPSDDFEVFLARAGDEHPPLASAFQRISNVMAEHEFALFAYRQSTSTDALIDNVNLLVRTSGAVAPDTLAAAIEQQLQDTGAHAIVSTAITVNGRDALKMTFQIHTSTMRSTVYTTQYFVFGSDKLAVLTIGTGEPDQGEDAAAIAESITFD